MASAWRLCNGAGWKLPVRKIGVTLVTVLFHFTEGSVKGGSLTKSAHHVVTVFSK